MAAPWTALVAVTDTNVLLRRAGHEVLHDARDRHDALDLFRGTRRVPATALGGVLAG